MSAARVPTTKSRRLFVYDRENRINFLIDTGADISVLPANCVKNRSASTFELYAANNTVIKTYGQKSLTLSLGFRRSYRWDFIVADVDHAIVGADFLSHYGLLPDLRNGKLVDSTTTLAVIGKLRDVEYTSISTVDHSSQLAQLLESFPRLTQATGRRECRIQHNTTHVIETTGQPITARPRRLPADKLKFTRAHFEDLIQKGDIRPSKSPWASPIHVVPKKGAEKWRVCGDYRRLNTITKPDRYPVPNIMDFNVRLDGAKIFTVIDIQRAYNHIPVAKDDVEKTAVTTPFGLYEYVVMPYGLRNAAQTFQRFIDGLFRDLDFVYAYLDDILIASADEENHDEQVRQVLQRLDDAGIVINMAKCQYARMQVLFLGHSVNAEGIAPDAERVKAITDFPKPLDVRSLKRFLGMINFYRRCIPKAASIQSRLQILINSNKKRDTTPLTWTPDAEKAFTEFKHALITATTLAHPKEDATLALFTDASDRAIGGALHQSHGDSSFQPLAFFSRKLSEAERRYSTYDRELLAIFASVRYFRTYLEGRNFIIYTDHKPLQFALAKASENASPRVARQLEFVSQFTTDIRYLPGENNVPADVLSRIATINTQGLDYAALADAQKDDAELRGVLASTKTGLVLKRVLIPQTKTELYVDMSTDKLRPFVPKELRYEAFCSIHRWSHPGPKATVKMVSDRFVWPNMKKDCAEWTKACLACQKSKVGRHIKSPLGQFEHVGRFEHLHVDIVGPLPPSQGKRYVVTMIDRTSKWPEAVPTNDISATAVAELLLSTWIARFGAPTKLTTDQGRQFDSDLIKKLSARLGIQKIRTTAFHPQANGMVERWHRGLKAAIKAYENDNWVSVLPLVLLGLRSAVSVESGVSPAQLTYGAQLRLPSEFFVLEKEVSLDEPEFVRQLSAALRKFSAKTRQHGKFPVYVPASMATCKYVFVRVVDAQSGALTQPYKGPYKVLEKGEKSYVIDIEGENKRISIDRLKPAYLLKEPTPVKKEIDPPIKKKQPERTVRFRGVYVP